MNDYMETLINEVFRELESLDEREFQKVLKKYEKDPLTELLANTRLLANDSPYDQICVSSSIGHAIYSNILMDRKSLSTTKDISAFSVDWSRQNQDYLWAMAA